jgi:hypothetical protein
LNPTVLNNDTKYVVVDRTNKVDGKQHETVKGDKTTIVSDDKPERFFGKKLRSGENTNGRSDRKIVVVACFGRSVGTGGRRLR